MFILSHLLSALASVLDVLFDALEIAILVRVVLSWANADAYNPFVRTIFVITEPFLAPFRKLLPPWKLGGLDLSPAFALLALYFIRLFLIPTLFDLAAKAQ
jgi:YggT family protein